MSTDIKRFSGRTYGRSQQDSSASKAFDDIFVKPKTKNMKWGNASFSKSREDDDPDAKKIKLEESSDPFSFEFDGDRSPKKKPALQSQQPRTVVLQPAVRYSSKTAANWPLKSEAVDDNMGDDLEVRRGPVRTYSKRSSRKVKLENDASQQHMDKYLKPSKPKHTAGSTDSSQNSSQSSSEPSQNTDQSEEQDDDLYIEDDDGSNADTKDSSFILDDSEKDAIFKRPIKKEGGEDEITVRFRSRYLDPEVYSKFTANITPKDPIGALSNSRVVHKNILKHESGTTLIVVCSPKTDCEKSSNTQTKYFKDSAKEIAKASSAAHIEELATKNLPAKVAEDPYKMEDDPAPDNSESQENTQTSVESTESHITISSATTEESPIPAPNVNPPTNGRVMRSSTVTNAAPSNPVSAKVVPPRKYHRIFRSRNKGLAVEEPSPQPVSSEPEPSSQSSEEPIETTLGESQDNVMETAESSQASTDEQGQGTDDTNVMKLPLLINMSEEAGDSDIDSSQQSNASDGANTPSDELEKEIPRPKKKVRPPPAERKIFRSRGNRTSEIQAEEAPQKKIFNSPKKAAAVYNVRSWQEDEDEQAPPPQPSRCPAETSPEPQLPSEPPKLKPHNPRKPGNRDDKAVPTEMPRLSRAVHWQGKEGDEGYTSLHVSKQHKELYTVVRNTKEAHEVQEFGETQEFDDDIEYLLAGIEEVEPMSTRCLSCIGLAQKSIIPAFRMHLRAHGTVTQIFGCLQDATTDPSLALCTSLLMFMLSRDRLNMDLDQESLNLMLRLLGVDQQEDLATTQSPTATRALNRNKDRVREVHEQFQKQIGNKLANVDLDSLSTGNLAMESLLSLTSRRAGEWFKEELRSLGALDHIVDTVCSCTEAVGVSERVLTNSSLENLKKTDRCLRVLENVTYLNADNQTYLISYKECCLVASLSRAIRMCHGCLAVYPLTQRSETGRVDKESFGWVIYSCILAILRVLLNLTHDNEPGCSKIGQQSDLIETVLLCILQSPQYVPVDFRFDLFVLSLGLLINLVEHCDSNRAHVIAMETRPAYENPVQDTAVLATYSLVEVFCQKESAASQLEEEEPKTPEKSPNKSGEWRESDSGMEWVIDSTKKDRSMVEGRQDSRNRMEELPGKDLDDEETFTKALHKAGKHMENSIVAAYVALLVGCLIQDNKVLADQVMGRLPEKTFNSMIYMLKKFLSFMNLTSGGGSTGGKSIERVINVLEGFQ